mgnify:CR=1 FL=1
MVECEQDDLNGSIRGPALARLILALVVGASMSACVSVPADDSSKKPGTWQPAKNQDGVTVEQMLIACRDAITGEGFDTVVVLDTMIGVCMRNNGFEIK